MSCASERFTIVKGLYNEYIFTIKQTGTTLPMEIDAGDTFIARLYKLEDGSELDILTVAVEDAANGKLNVSISAEDTAQLDDEKGDKADRYYSRPMYKLVIACDTLNNGKFLARLPLVYVE